MENILKTGLPLLDNMLDGGLKPGNLYGNIGVALGWKSGMLLNIGIGVKTNNEYVQTKDPDKKPVILVLSQENVIGEILLRIWSHLYGNKSEPKDYESKEVEDMLLSSNVFSQTNGQAELVFKYRSTRSITTADIDNMIDELALENKEVVLLIHDHMRRVKSTKDYKDINLEHAVIAKEMKKIAIDRNIPVVTALQANREMSRVFEEAENSIEEIVKSLKDYDNPHMYEYSNTMKIFDSLFIQNIIRNDESPTKLFIKSISEKSKDSFTYDFVENNTMRLNEDTGTVIR